MSIILAWLSKILIVVYARGQSKAQLVQNCHSKAPIPPLHSRNFPLTRKRTVEGLITTDTYNTGNDHRPESLKFKCHSKLPTAAPDHLPFRPVAVATHTTPQDLYIFLGGKVRGVGSRRRESCKTLSRRSSRLSSPQYFRQVCNPPWLSQLSSVGPPVYTCREMSDAENGRPTVGLKNVVYKINCYFRLNFRRRAKFVEKT